jgi:CubicO group peptidase (beta-lactamase class C family)
MNELRPGSPREAGISSEHLDILLDKCREWVNTGATPALSVLAARKGIVFMHGSWGRLTPGPDSAPVKADSRFGMASCSKPVTAAAVMSLVEEGRLALHHPLQEYLPAFRGPSAERVTIRHLLSHTSGLPSSTDSEIINAAEQGLDYEPGTKVVYSSAAYDLLGEVVEKISGKSFEDFAQQQIFAPLGMDNTTFIHMGLDRDRCVQARPGTTYDWPQEYEGTTSASSSLWSTAYDMGIFLHTFLNKGCYGHYRLLSEACVEKMTRDQTPGIPRELVDGVPIPSAGLGWFLLGSGRFPNYPSSFSMSSFGHSGASGAFIWVDPSYNLVGAFLFTKVKEGVRPLDCFVDRLMDCILT